VFVRPLSMDEGPKLQKITRSAKNPVRLRRAMVVMMSGQGQTVRDITSLLQVSEDYVRDVIHAFDERGFDALDPKPSGDVDGRSVISSDPGSARSPSGQPRPRRGCHCHPGSIADYGRGHDPSTVSHPW
jgi:hypothetical protein